MATKKKIAKSKKVFDPASFVGKTLEESLLDLITSVDKEYCKPIDATYVVPIAITISDKSGHVLYKETASTKRKIGDIKDRTDTKKFISTVESIFIKHRCTIETKSVKITSVSAPQVLKIRNKDEKYVKVEIVIDGYPTLREAVEVAYKQNCSKIKLFVVNTVTHKTTLFVIDTSIGDVDAFYALFNSELGDKKLTWAPKYSSDCCEFDVQI